MSKRKIFLISLFSAILLVFLVALIIALIGITVFSDDPRYYWSFVLFFIYLANSITSFYLLNNKRRIDSVKLRWIFIINFLPIFGLFLFYIFGLIPLKIVNKYDIIQANSVIYQNENFSYTEKVLGTDEFSKSDFAFLYNYNQAPIYENNHLELLNQNDLLERMIYLIDKAERYIHIQYFILSDSLFFFLLFDLLVKKAQSGVKIRILYDWVGSHRRLSKYNVNYLKKAGIEIKEFNPAGFNKFTSLTNFRSHRKLFLVDNKYCITGGSNIGDEYINLKRDAHNWKDLNFYIEGEIVNSFNLTFINDWNNYTSFYRVDKNLSLIDFKEKGPIYKTNKKNAICQLINSSPEQDIFIFKALICSKIASAKKSIWIYTPYLLLPQELIEQLVLASIKDVDIRIIVPHLSDDQKYVITSNRSFYKHLLTYNVKIYEYYGFNHAKAIIIDDKEVLIGTNNLDFRSMIINYETAINVHSVELNMKLKEQFLKDMKNSVQIDLSYFKSQNKLHNKLSSAFINIIHPLL